MGTWIIGVFGVVLFLVGSIRFVLKHRFGPIDALYCCLAVVTVGLFLLVFSCVLQHARLASIIPLFVGGIMIFSFLAIDVALGLAVLGVVSRSSVRGMEKQKGLPKSTGAHGGGNSEGGYATRIIDCRDPFTLGWIYFQLPQKTEMASDY